jgi:hypothetical protein
MDDFPPSLDDMVVALGEAPPPAPLPQLRGATCLALVASGACDVVGAYGLADPAVVAFFNGRRREVGLGAIDVQQRTRRARVASRKIHGFAAISWGIVYDALASCPGFADVVLHAMAAGCASTKCFVIYKVLGQVALAEAISSGEGAAISMDNTAAEVMAFVEETMVVAATERGCKRSGGGAFALHFALVTTLHRVAAALRGVIFVNMRFLDQLPYKVMRLRDRPWRSPASLTSMQQWRQGRQFTALRGISSGMRPLSASTWSAWPGATV